VPGRGKPEDSNRYTVVCLVGGYSCAIMMIIIAISNKNTVLSKEPVKKAENLILK
jgi:lipoprotein